MAVKVADYILGRLAEEKVDTIFLVYGGAIGELVDAIGRQDKIKYVATMGEQCAGFAAEGYAKTRHHLGVALATSGPGGGNLMTAIQNCYYDSVPVLFITGQVNTRFMRKDKSMRQLGFQETDIVGMAAPITKYAKTLKDPKEIRLEVERAITIALSGRPGPVLLDIPTDVAKMPIDATDPWPPGHIFDAKYDNPANAIVSFLADLRASEKPVILIGGGCANNKEEVYALLDKLRIPAFPTWNGLDIVSSDLPNYGGRVGTYGGPGRNFGIQNCDLLLAIGSRISGRITGGQPHTFAPNAKKYYVDVDRGILNKKNQEVPANVNIYCSAGWFMLELTKVCGIVSRPRWMSRVRNWRNKYDPVKAIPYGWHHYHFMRKMSEAMPSNAIITADTGGNVIMFAHAFQTKKGQRYFTNNGNTPMGFSMAAAIGAWFADPTRPVVCIIGDGGFQFNIQELQTIKHYKIPLKVFVFNNKCLGNTKIYQKENFGGRYAACGPDGYSCPDFVAIARAYGLEAYRADSVSHYDAIPHILAYNGPVVIDVVHDDFCDYLPKMVRWDKGIECMTPDLPDSEMKENME